MPTQGISFSLISRLLAALDQLNSSFTCFESKMKATARAEHHAAGSRLVDLRNVRSMEGALGQLCGALDISMVRFSGGRVQ